MRKLHPSPAMVVAIIALVLAVSGGAYAAGRQDAKTVAACEHQQGGGLYLAARCRRGDTRVTWNIEGPRGQRGSAGSAGAPGAVGPMGATGAQGPVGQTGAQGPATGPAGGDLTGTYPSPRIADGAITPAKLAAPEAWHTVGAPGQPVFNDGAHDTTGSYVCSGPVPQPAGCPTYYPVGFYKDALGVVHLRGTFAMGTSTIVFQLPPGYRTAQAAAFTLTVSTGVHATLIIYDSGTAQIIQSSYSGNEIYSLDGISFQADA